MIEYSRRVIDLRTRIVHASSLEKSGHYDYVDYTACNLGTAHAPHEWFQRDANETVTCLRCIAEMSR